mmetsp:Transcript_14922/g.22227  ORF Transcript_14922/g.22227 Transcript_14922/m.22227 type:complete len:256 (+) Transcript_14922:792-1559(+)
MPNAISDFLDEPAFQRYNTSIILNSNGFVSKSEIVLNHVDIEGSKDSERAMIDVRDLIEGVNVDGYIFAFSSFYPDVESDLILVEQLLYNFMYALLVIFVFSVAVLGHIRYSLLVCLLIAMVDAEVMGFIHFWGLRLNTVTAVQLIMAAGIITDMIVHIVHYFVAVQKDRRMGKVDRIVNAGSEIGPSVLFASLTTFIGVLPLAIAQNAIFRTFFSMLLSIIVLGMLAGLITLPLMLRILPERVPEDKQENLETQ